MPDRDPLQSNTPLALARESPVPKGGSILSDRIGHLLARQTKNRRNPYQDPVREVRVKTKTGKVLRILSNDLDRRSLQAPLGDRAVLPLGQADPQDHPLPRHLRERHPHPDRRRAHRLPPAPPRTRPPKARSLSPGWSVPSHASPTHRPLAPPRAGAEPQHHSTGPPMELKPEPDSRGLASTSPSRSPAPQKFSCFRLNVQTVSALCLWSITTAASRTGFTGARRWHVTPRPPDGRRHYSSGSLPKANRGVPHARRGAVAIGRASSRRAGRRR